MNAEGTGSARVDAWLWAVRVYRTRSLASQACRAGHVRVGASTDPKSDPEAVRAKPATTVGPGDVVRVRGEGRERVLEVRRVISKRVGAAVAAECYIDHSPPPPPRELTTPIGMRDRGAGRPTKRERRELDQLRGRPRP